MYLRLAVLFVAVFIALGVTLPQDPAAKALATCSDSLQDSPAIHMVNGGERCSVSDDVEDLIDQIIDALDGCVNAIAADPPPLSAATKDIIRENLLDVEALIEQLQDPEVEPDLEPPDAGIPGSSPQFNTLEDCAEQCANWADEALTEGRKVNEDQEVVGNLIDSILLTLPQYRDLADL
jgi:hypothetical protein